MEDHPVWRNGTLVSANRHAEQQRIEREVAEAERDLAGVELWMQRRAEQKQEARSRDLAECERQLEEQGRAQMRRRSLRQGGSQLRYKTKLNGR